MVTRRPTRLGGSKNGKSGGAGCAVKMVIKGGSGPSSK